MIKVDIAIDGSDWLHPSTLDRDTLERILDADRKQKEVRKSEDPITLLSLTDEIAAFFKQQEAPTPDTGRGSDWDYYSSNTTVPGEVQDRVTPQGKEWWQRTEPAKKGFFGDEYLPVPDASGTEPLLEGTRVNPKKIFFHGDEKQRAPEEYFTGLGFGRGKLHFSDIGAWFSDSEENARWWADRGFGDAKREGVVNRVNLSMENPRIFEDQDEFVEWLGNRSSGMKVQKDLKKEGYDGIIIEDSWTDNYIHRTDVVVFDKEQIKEAPSSPTTSQAEIDFKEILKLPEITEEQKSNSPLKFYLETVAGIVEEGRQIPRYWSHRPPGTLGPAEDGGIQAYKISGRGGEAEAISEKFKDGSNQKIIWLQSPAHPNDPYIVDASKLNLVNVGSEASGFQHAGDIPSEAIVKGPDTQPVQAEEGKPTLPPEIKKFMDSNSFDLDDNPDITKAVIANVNDSRVKELGEKYKTEHNYVFAQWVEGKFEYITGVRAVLAELRGEELDKDRITAVFTEINSHQDNPVPESEIPKYVDWAISSGRRMAGGDEAVDIFKMEQSFAEKRTKELFGDSMTVYRAVYGKQADQIREGLDADGEIEIDNLVGASFSTSRSASYVFAKSQGGGRRDNIMIMKHELNADEVLSAWYAHNGFNFDQFGAAGQPWQQEVVANPKNSSIRMTKDDFVSSEVLEQEFMDYAIENIRRENVEEDDEDENL